MRKPIPLFKEFLDDFSQFLKLEKEGLRWTLNVDKIEALRDLTETLDAYTKANATLNQKYELMGLPRRLEKMGGYAYDSNGNFLWSRNVRY